MIIPFFFLIKFYYEYKENEIEISLKIKKKLLMKITFERKIFNFFK